MPPAKACRGKERNGTQMRRSAIGLLAGLFVSACVGSADASGITPRSDVRASIIGGASAKQGALKFMAFIQSSTSTRTIDCSGTVVAPTLVLTAAHCVIDASTGAVNAPSSYVVVTGSAGLANAGPLQVSDVSKVIADPSYNPTQHDADAALLVLSTPTSAPSVSLGTGGPAQAGAQAMIAGWGLTDASVASAPAVLQFASTVVQASAYCGNYSPVYDASQICAMDYPRDLASICFGDSGGPLLVSDNHSFVEIGIDAYVVSATCAPSAPQYFTGIEPVQSWIQQEIRAFSQRSPVPSVSVTPSLRSKPKARTAPAVSATPGITPGQAWSDTRRVLTRLYGTAFENKADSAHSCLRLGSTRSSCSLTFSSNVTGHSSAGRSFYYYGTVTVYSVKVSSKAGSWSADYIVHRVDDYCYSHSLHPSRCKVNTKHGSWAPPTATSRRHN